MIFLISLFFFLSIYNNCSAPEAHSPLHGQAEGASQRENGFVEADFLSEEKPELLCGTQGYEFLLKQYFGVHCAVCHDRSGGFEPYFAQNQDASDSYYKALYINEDTFIETITENRFCGIECSLNKDGETYKAIAEWLENKWACPTN